MAVVIDTLAAAMELLAFHKRQFSDGEHIHCVICRSLRRIILREM